MKDRRKRSDVVVSWSRFFWCTLVVVFTCVFISGFTFSTFRILFQEKIEPVLILRWKAMPVESISGDSSVTAASISIREVIVLPDQALVFLNYPPSAQLFTKEDIACVYSSLNTSTKQKLVKKSPISVDRNEPSSQIVRCRLPPRGFAVTAGLKLEDDTPAELPVNNRWDSLAYEALIDRDNTTIVFVKGFNLRPERVSNASKFECVYGWDFKSPKFLLRSEVISIAQEIVRCKTPLSLLSGSMRLNNSVIKVSVRMKGRGTINTIARPKPRPESEPSTRKVHEMCVCTMVRNQARFLKEWVMYHSVIGVQRWFIYDNNSNDDLDRVIESLYAHNYNITRHVWPWVKTQEAGFAHCAVRARDTCEWVGFIDVDEFIHLPTDLLLHDVLTNQTEHNRHVAELRTSCHSFGPSGLKRVPSKGVTVGYTCRLAIAERHKSIVKPEALNSSLINVVHHFHLRDGFEYVNVDRGVMVINHYKYQVWEVFKDKFYRRVATYVADWQDDQNVGSKDRAPGLGTRAVEPPDWSDRFCEVTDTGLRDRVLQSFSDPLTHILPWQKQKAHNSNNNQKTRRKIRRRGFL
ncbi:glycosyltransferase family 92 protein RCOM_0530710-like isoform X2 [Humulus lupulus]|uniref:glycosyltransferase family 92 protein RCOM_0530710-like isoform X2 n=1 Tax=Humulus lupulus TaxID=3486 RepID=UPI002B408ED8|nr:glycosyltransferase family 92 protein RCOM_0530710-like isoform X2 [Humulus lupulus]